MSKMKPSILFVDDQTNVLMALDRILHDQKDKWDMVFIDSYSKAVDWLAKNHCDVAVLDVKIPGRNRFELLSYIKSDFRTKDIEVIMVTGLDDEKLKRYALTIGARDLLNKPIQKEDLLARLNNVLQLKSYKDKLKEQNSILEQQLIQSQKMKVVGMLYDGVVHDFNNILTIIQGYPELIKLRIKKNHPVDHELEMIQHAVNRARKIMNQLLKLSKQKKVLIVNCDIGSLIDESLDLLNRLIPSYVQIEWKRPKKKFIINADPAQLNQVLVNLLINAVQSMKKEGTLTIGLSEIEVEPETDLGNNEISPGKYLKLEVTDTGDGIDPEIQKHIFEPRYSKKESKKGYGLGLFVVDRIVSNHKGFINLKSEAGKGTSFFVFFPYSY